MATWSSWAQILHKTLRRFPRPATRSVTGSHLLCEMKSLKISLFTWTINAETGHVLFGRFFRCPVMRAGGELFVQFLPREFRSRDRINFKVILSDELVRPNPTPASIFTVLEYRSKTPNNSCDCLLAERNWRSGP